MVVIGQQFSTFNVTFLTFDHAVLDEFLDQLILVSNIMN
jgi:hypothetical protein